MGCGTSKPKDSPAVLLCRDRLNFIQHSIHQRSQFSIVHVSYIHSLHSLGLSLHHFFSSSSSSHPPHHQSHVSPAPVVPTTPPPPRHHSPPLSDSGSHLHFHSDDDSDDAPHHHHHHNHDDSDSGLTSPLHQPDPYPYSYPYSTGVQFNPYVQMNYMKRHVTPSVTYHQKPPTSDYYYAYGPNGSGPASMNPPTPDYYYGPVPGSMKPPTQDYYYGPTGQGPTKPDREQPPPPPPPPEVSTWDFLNFFDGVQNDGGYRQEYTPSRESWEVREEEGIPDLEHEVVKEVDEIRSNHKDGSKEKHIIMTSSEEEDDEEERERGGVEYEVHMVDKKVVGDDEEKSKGGGGGGGGGKLKSVTEVVTEIQVQFERASNAAHEIDKVLEVGKVKYHKNHAYQVSMKMLNAITPSLPSSSKDTEASLDPDEAMQIRATTLSASLQKLYLWEKKLFDEVKAEEKMRLLHDRKVQKLKRLDERGAEAQKIDATTNAIRELSTKIRMAIQVVDKISVKINKVRDEELWPQLHELIQGLSRMWKSMHECHHSQSQAIEGAKSLDAIAFPQNTNDIQLEASLQLEHDLINWTCRFTEWIGAQTGFVRALHSWLFKCLLIEPEVTADGVAPYSPGRAGAPPIFVICNQWNQSLDRISETSEKEVVDSMRVFSMMVWHLRERDKGEMRQRMTTNREMERKVKSLEREDVRMQKEMQALDKKMILSSGGADVNSLSGNVVYQSDTSNKVGSFQAGLMRIFEAMNQFTSDSVKVYEELLQRTEEVVRDQSKVS